MSYVVANRVFVKPQYSEEFEHRFQTRAGQINQQSGFILMEILKPQSDDTPYDDKGRAGFVMANSASDARGSEMEIRRQIIEDGGVDVMVAIGSNFFYTVTLPCSLWFFDKGKSEDRKNKVLFIYARHIFRQVTRAVRDFNSEQLNFIANIVRLYRGEAIDNTFVVNHPDESTEYRHAGLDPASSEYNIEQHFSDGYQDIADLCKVATIAEIDAQGWSLNPGRYVGVAQGEEEHDEDFAVRLEALQEELEVLNGEAHELERAIAENMAKILDAV